MTRQDSLTLRSQVLRLPCFFPSISSVKTNFRPIEYLSTLVATGEPQFLISAYDIRHEEDQLGLKLLLEKARTSGQVVLLDSGNYEKFWKNDEEWSPTKLAGVLSWPCFPLAFCFDDQTPPKDMEELVAGIENAVLREQRHCVEGSMIPIVHAQTEQLPEAVIAVARRLYPLMVAVPERELGNGILTRAGTVSAIRKALNTLETYVPLHILGTGNPRSILILAASGADSFDGLEWCQTTVDTSTGNLHHFQHRELFQDACAFCNDANLSYSIATLGHNLLFMRRLMTAIQQATREEAMENLLARYLPSKVISRILRTVDRR
jgi:queuine/archaeosine tRNA-ribosyltransferase